MIAKLTIAHLALCCVIISAAFIEVFNPLGYGQRIYYGQQPPYRWLVEDTSDQFTGSIKEVYIGANDRICATVYRFASLDVLYKVYGYGFSESYETQRQAEQEAERECR
ncbi:MAG: hypothetical protein ABR905_22165 [Terracidiphilus sp.]|jgi:hypothetical protein